MKQNTLSRVLANIFLFLIGGLSLMAIMVVVKENGFNSLDLLLGGMLLLLAMAVWSLADEPNTSIANKIKISLILFFLFTFMIFFIGPKHRQLHRSYKALNPVEIVKDFYHLYIK